MLEMAENVCSELSLSHVIESKIRVERCDNELHCKSNDFNGTGIHTYSFLSLDDHSAVCTTSMDRCPSIRPYFRLSQAVFYQTG